MQCHVSSVALPGKLPGSTPIYDGVFACSTPKGRVSPRPEDYSEVFSGGGGENACRATIPVLDVPCFHEARLRVDVRTSSLDYLKIFGGGDAVMFPASYEEVVGRCAGTELGGGRVNTKKRSPSLVSNNGLEEASVVEETSILSSNEAKIFSVSYSKSNVGSNGNGTVRVAQLADIPGYSVLVEESKEQIVKDDVVSDTSGGMVKGVNCRNASSRASVEIPAAAESSREDIYRRRSSKGGSFSDEILFDRCGFMVGKDSYREGPPYNFSTASFDKKGETNGRFSPRSVSDVVDSSHSPSDLGGQLDSNSAAAASVAAVKIAIEKAQARIKAAKEIMEGKKVFDFQVRAKKKFDSKDKRVDKTAEKEHQNSKNLHQKVSDEDTQVHSTSRILKPNLAEAELESGEMGDKVKELTLEESNVVGLEENRDKTGVGCWKGEVANREEEDLFEDARAEPYHPERDEVREVTGVKTENESLDVPKSNSNISSSRNSAVVENAEAALGEALCHEKTNPLLLTSTGAKGSQEWMIPSELSEELNRKKENRPDSSAVSDDIEGVKKFAFYFHVTPLEKLPELKISKPNVNSESQLLIEHNLVKCAADEDDLTDEGDSEMREDLGMTLGDGEDGDQQEQYRDLINCEIQLDENSPEYPAASPREKPENGVSEIYDNALPKERNDHLTLKNYGDCQEDSEVGESPDCKECELCETVLSDGNQMEDLKIRPGICDIIETAKVPADTKARRRHWTVEAQDISRLINALAANACEPNVHGPSTQRSYEHSEDQTADEITDDVEKEDDDRILSENSSPELGDAEFVATEVASDSIIEGPCTDEPIELINDTFRDDEINQGDDAAEAFNSREDTANIEDACVDIQLTDDEASDRSSRIDSPAQGACCELGDAKLNETEVSSGPESEASVKEANSETGVEFSGDDLCCFDKMAMEVQQLDAVFTEKRETQTVEVGMDADKTKENHRATQTTEEVGAGGPGSEMQVKESRCKNVEEEKEKKKEREKERLAVERAIQEARQRAYEEARKRAERAAVEKATSEARQRRMARSCEKVGKSSSVELGSKADDNRSVKAKLKAERAAVERATAEARERALEKALVGKLAAGDKDSKPGKKSHEQQHRSSGSASNSRLPSASGPGAGRSEGNSGESAQRRKARLERHQRMAERAAKALAEKNKRDLLAQREQAERNRLAETLDFEIKRWSSGKQGNLRALLSTLQYILGPDSGWQPVTLTEIVTAAAVRKAYRKATLYVHPDKVQQRGASLQQKYICEKVFDLLKDAWNKFSLEER